VQPVQQRIERARPQFVAVARQLFHHADAEHLLLGRVMEDVHAGEGQQDVAQGISHRYRKSILLISIKVRRTPDDSMRESAGGRGIVRKARAAVAQPIVRVLPEGVP